MTSEKREAISKHGSKKQEAKAKAMAEVAKANIAKGHGGVRRMLEGSKEFHME